MRAICRVFAFAAVGMRVGLELAGDGRIGCGCLEERRREPIDGEYHGAGDGSDVSNQFDITGPGSRVFGEEDSCGRFETSPKLYASGSTAFEGQPLCTYASNEAGEECGEEIAYDLGPSGAGCGT